MSGLVKGLFGGGGAPARDKTAEALQKQQLQNEQDRASDLAADEAAQRRALDTGRVGRSLLAFTPKSSAPKEKLGS